MTKPLLRFSFFFGIIPSVLFISCQRDDICSENITTPKLIIRFYNATDISSFRTVTNLRVFEAGSSTEIASTASTDSIAIPLRSLADSVTYVFVSNSNLNDQNVETSTDVDTLMINYTVEERFLSRGCGVVANYQLNSIQIEDGERWIINTEITNPTVSNENAAHVQIFY